MSLCMGCMTDKGESVICPKCGLNEQELKNASQNFLQPGSRLNDRYTVGIALGQGGFGITYIGYDNVLGTRVAIKEYYPNDSAQRESESRTVRAFAGGETDFEKGKEKFLTEARTLARFSEYPGVVSVKDCFGANGTAYMVMQYLDGTDLKQYLNRRGGKLGESESIQILMPVTEALKEIHKTGIIHRDISPDNIFMTKDGQVKLIDFGAARQSFGDNKSISVTLKPGYAPEEQYRTRGNQGPWTDVYALSATLYRMVTGNTPPESIERVMDDELVIPDYLSDNIRYALKKGMAVKAADRFENMSEFQNAIVSGNQAENNGAKPLAADAPLSNTMSVKAFDSENEHNGKNKSDTPSTQKRLKIALGSIAAALVICIAVLLGIVIGSKKETPTDVGVTSKNKQKTTQSTSSASDRKSSNSKANANSSSSSSSSAQTAPAQQPTQKTVDRAADERLLYTTLETNLNAYVNGVNTGDTSAVSGYIDSSTEFYHQEVEQIKSYYAKGVRERLISYNIVNVEWIDDDSCYLTQHSVIEVNRNGKVKNADETYTYLMRRIGGKFYYIKPTDR